MLRKENGVTLIALIITIVVMIILAGAIISTSNIVEQANRQKIGTSMILIQTKVKIIMEKADFSGDSSYYVGTQNESGLYELNQEDLNQMGLQAIKLDGEKYLVNYETGEIMYEKGDIEYSISDFM